MARTPLVGLTLLMASFFGHRLTVIYNRIPGQRPGSQRNISPGLRSMSLTTCSKKSMGFDGLTIPVCKTVAYYNSKSPVVSWRTGKIDKKTAEAIKRQYNGLFLEQAVGVSRDSGRQRHDYDMCCPTTHIMKQAPEIFTNVHGENFTTLDLSENGIYQYYRVGICQFQGRCQGTCVEQNSVVYLLVFSNRFEHQVSFEPYEVPSYCSCQNIGRSPARGNLTGNESPARGYLPGNESPARENLTGIESETSERQVSRSMDPFYTMANTPVSEISGTVVTTYRTVSEVSHNDQISSSTDSAQPDIGGEHTYSMADSNSSNGRGSKNLTEN